MQKKKSGVIGVIISVIILIILIIVSNNNGLSFFENLAGNIVTPIKNGIIYLKNKNDNNYLASVEKLENENKDLKEQNNNLVQKLRELEVVKAENETLKEYLSLKEKYSEYTTIPAYVISKDIGNYNKMFVINVGEKDGIKENMNVIANQGLVGHVVSVTDTTAKVQTILDNSSAVSAVLTSTRDNIICKGSLENNELKGIYIPIESNVVVGDNVETSGMGGIYSKGIHIGTVKQLVSIKNKSDRYILVDPAVDFDKIEDVLVVTNN